jgi:anti-sigma B factor antagonist
MTAPLTVAPSWHGAIPVARVEGEVDMLRAGELGLRLRELLTNRSHGLVVDLTATGYLDSAGINLLFALGAELEARQQRLRVVVAEGSPIQRMLSITGFDRAYATHATLDEALAAR